MKLLLILLSTLLLLTINLHAESIKIGILTDLSGLGAYWGKQTEVGSKILEEEYKQTGQNVQFIFEDHKLEPKFGVSGVQNLLNLHQVDAVYSEFAVINNPIAPILAKAQKLFMGTSAAVSFLKYTKRQ